MSYTPSKASYMDKKVNPPLMKLTSSKTPRIASQRVKPVQKAPVKTGNVEQIIRTAANKYGINPDYAVRIAQCESGLNPNAVNQYYNENGNPSGLFQHLSGYYPARAVKYGYSPNVFDAYSNANVTMAMWRDGQQGLWECQ